jgi:hypothetical protein
MALRLAMRFVAFVLYAAVWMALLTDAIRTTRRRATG